MSRVLKASAPSAALVYVALSVALTWPLVLGLGSNVPGDLGDSLLNMWILGWGAQHVPPLLTGQIGWADFWNANIFHPEPLSLAMSEHLFAQVLQILPIYWLTGNIILCYNLLFISTFALSAFGAYLLVRDLTGDTRAAFVAGLIYGFLPYRIAAVPHMQVMSSQWMPFALWGLNRFVTPIPASGSRLSAYAALAGGTIALVLQNWSCGYYLLYFAPFVPLFVVHRMWIAGTLRAAGTWAGLGAAALGTLALTLPFLFKYQEAQQAFGFERPWLEVVRFSASAWSYLTASENLLLYGNVLRFHPNAEGETFLGVVPWLLAAVAVSSVIPTRHSESSVSQGRGVVTAVLSLAVGAGLIALIAVMLAGGIDLGFISARSPLRLLVVFGVSLAALLALSPRARTETGRIVRSPITFALAATLAAMWLSLGANSAAYRLLHEYVPGFNGVRVPARFAMIVGLFLSVGAGFGARRILAQVPSPKSQALFAALAALILVEGAAMPLEINRVWKQNEAMPPSSVTTYADAPPVYGRLKALPAGSAITEFPFGDAAWEIRYVYYAAAHLKPITNGYSGNFPPNYTRRVARLQFLDRDPEASWQSLKDTGTTHVVVHRRAFADGARADVVEAWLKAHGAAEIERFEDGDVLFEL